MGRPPPGALIVDGRLVMGIGGGLSRAGGALFDELRGRLAERLSFHRLPALIPAQLQGDAGLIGAALRARELA